MVINHLDTSTGMIHPRIIGFCPGGVVIPLIFPNAPCLVPPIFPNGILRVPKRTSKKRCGQTSRRISINFHRRIGVQDLLSLCAAARGDRDDPRHISGIQFSRDLGHMKYREGGGKPWLCMLLFFFREMK